MDAAEKDFRDELAALINRHCRENESNTPDFLLADYMAKCLAAFESVVERRERWYGREPEQIMPPIAPEA